MGTAGIAAVTFASVLVARRTQHIGTGSGSSTNVAGPYGPLRPVADLATSLPLLMLPEGFQYRSFSWAGDPMANGEPTPDSHDGMGVIAVERRGGRSDVVLVRNHERGFASPIVAPARYDAIRPSLHFHAPGGGTTTLVFRGREWVSVEPSLCGTLVNCAGGVTPWGSWLSCEETLIDSTADGGCKHGYVFEVRRKPEETTGQPIVGMGRLLHEAVAVDPETHVAYMTEDNPNRCTLYRFVPDDPSGTAGSYERGGRLQAARVVGQGNADFRVPALGDEFRIEWIDLERPDADPGNAPAEFTDISGSTSGPFLEAWSKGALRLSRGEGICAQGGKIYVVDTTAGLGSDGRRGWGEGALWELDPRAATLRPIFVAGSQIVGDNIDNVTVNSRGGIVLCEDGEPVIDEYGPGTRLLGLTTAGESFAFAKNVVQLTGNQVIQAGKKVLPGDYRASEWCGACFDPAGKVLFANLQEPGITFAIWGPWTKGNL